MKRFTNGYKIGIGLVLFSLFIGICYFTFRPNPSLNTPDVAASIHDECFSWDFPKGVAIERYDPCSSLTLIQVKDGREFKANFVLTMPVRDGGRDSFLGKQEIVIVDANSATRYLYDGRNDDSGLGNYHIDYTINYDRLPLNTPRPDGRTRLTAEFVLATKDDTHSSDQEVEDFIELTDQIMGALHTN